MHINHFTITEAKRSQNFVPTSSLCLDRSDHTFLYNAAYGSNAFLHRSSTGSLCQPWHLARPHKRAPLEPHSACQRCQRPGPPHQRHDSSRRTAPFPHHDLQCPLPFPAHRIVPIQHHRGTLPLSSRLRDRLPNSLPPGRLPHTDTLPRSKPNGLAEDRSNSQPPPTCSHWRPGQHKRMAPAILSLHF